MMPEWTFRVKSTCTSFHQNGLYLQAMIGSLRRSLRDRFLCSSTVLLPLLFNNPLLSRTLSTSRPKWNRPASTASINGNHVVIANDIVIDRLRYCFLDHVELLRESCHLAPTITIRILISALTSSYVDPFTKRLKLHVRETWNKMLRKVESWSISINVFQVVIKI